MVPNAVAVAAQLASKCVHPKDEWLSDFLQSQRPSTPLQSLAPTALFRLLATDITTTLFQPEDGLLPLDIQNLTVKSRVLHGPILAQVLDIEDLSLSRWEQIEAIEALERGEGTKGREVIRVVPREDGEDSTPGQREKRGGPFKVLLQDARGTKAFAMELIHVDGISLGMSIGCKVVLRSVSVARGFILLDPAHVSILGGKIETWHAQWKDERKQRLYEIVNGQKKEGVS